MSYVYILTNECLPGMVKIGYTSKSPRERAEELHSSGVPAPFVVYHTVQTRNPVALEGKMHRHYAEQRVNPNREFFNVTPEQAKATLDDMANNNVDEYQLIEDFIRENFQTAEFVKTMEQCHDGTKFLNRMIFKRFKGLYVQLELKMDKFEFVAALVDKVSVVLCKHYNLDMGQTYIKKAAWITFCEQHEMPHKVEQVSTWRKNMSRATLKQQADRLYDGEAPIDKMTETLGELLDGQHEKTKTALGKAISDFLTKDQ